MTDPLHSRLAQLLLSKEHEEPNGYRQIHQQRHPEPRFPEPRHSAGRKIREDVARADFIGCGSSRQNSSNGTEDLCRDEGEEDVETRQGLQEYHAETDTLHSVKDTKPQPETPTRDRGSSGAAGPGEVEADVGDAPEHLSPAGGA